MTTRVRQSAVAALMALALLSSTGCLFQDRCKSIGTVENVSKELKKTTLPEHMIEPPDVLQIDLIAAVPKPPYKLQPLDAISLKVDAAFTLPGANIQGVYQIDTDGTVNLGSVYGAPVQIVGLTVAEAKEAIIKHLGKTIREPPLEIALAQTRGMQQVRGQHLVRPDGTVWFENYGAVRVVGLTVPQAKAAIEEHLAQFFLKPEVAISLTGFNSKVYYIIFDFGFGGSQLFRLPVTGNETVLDAMAQIGGLSQVADHKRIWIARPAPEGCTPQILPVDWKAITELAQVDSNYQVLPGDRIFVRAAPMVAFDFRMARFLAPIERLLGFYLLGQSVIQQSLQNRIGQQFLAQP